MEQIECEGNTVAEAVESALKALGLRRDQVEVQIIQEGSSGILGFGRKPAKVRVIEKRWGTQTPESPGTQSHHPEGHRKPPQEGRGRGRSPSVPPALGDGVGGQERDRGHRPPRPHDQGRRHGTHDRPRQSPIPAPAPGAQGAQAPKARGPEAHGPGPAPRESPETPLTAAEAETACARAAEILKRVLSLMGFEPPRVTTRWDADQERVMAVVDGPSVEILVGNDGRTLESLQFLVTVITTRDMKRPVAVWVDAMNFLEKREAAVLREARRGVENVKQTKKPFRLAPMDPAMRRLVHRSLANDPDVTTASEGEGPWRKVVIRPR